MKKLFALLTPYKSIFIVALLALTLSSFFNAALTGLVTSLMDGVLTETPVQTESKADKIFGYQQKLEDVKNWVQDLGIPIDSLSEKAQDLDVVNPLPWAILAFIVFSLQALFDFLGTYFMGRIGLKVIVKMRQDLIEKVVFMPLSFYKRFSTGEILTRINTDVVRIRQAVSVKLGELIKECSNTAVFLVLAFVMDWKLSLTLFVLVPMVGVPISIFTRKIRKYASKSQISLGHLTSRLKEVVTGIRIVKGFRKERFESQLLAGRNQDFFKYALRELRIVALTTPIMSLIGMVVILSFVWYGGSMIQQGAMTRGDFLFYLLIVYQLYQPIKRIARANSEIQQAVGVLPRIREILEWTSEIEDPAIPQRFESWPEIESIRFDKVGFHYGDPNEPVLRDVDLEVKKGTVVALVGPSGGGKSTLVNLIPRFYDVTSGGISINGLDIRKMEKADLRSLVGVVTQDTILFDDSVHENIAYGMGDVSREAVVEAAKKAHAHGFISALPQGYDTVIGESGGLLSGGQRQRISIARAILEDAPLLILDEATSALDTESERAVQLALENLMKTKTTFVIAHRLSTIRQAHEILVLEMGRIIERGTHEFLLAESGLYHKLIEMQKEGPHAP